jgi:hypothetical protein
VAWSYLDAGYGKLVGLAYEVVLDAVQAGIPFEPPRSSTHRAVLLWQRVVVRAALKIPDSEIIGGGSVRALLAALSIANGKVTGARFLMKLPAPHEPPGDIGGL